MTRIDRPLKLGELLAETVRIYGERIWAAFGIGLVVGGATLLADVVHVAVGLAIVSVVITLVYAAAARVVSGDSFAEAWAQVGLRLPILLVLSFIVAFPFALALGRLILVVLAVAWLALTGFAIPVAMLESQERGTWLERLVYALQRSLMLARTEYLHAAGVAAALVVIYLLFSVILVGALVGFAENGELAAVTLAQIVLGPFFFIGLSVLYFEQRERALSTSSQRS